MSKKEDGPEDIEYILTVGNFSICLKSHKEDIKSLDHIAMRAYRKVLKMNNMEDKGIV